jgi:hypothetical protein
MVPRFESALLAAAVVLVADSVPTFNVESFCCRVAAMAHPFADVDVCMRKEQEARDQLVQQWTQFPAADRSYCRQLTTTGGTRHIPSSSRVWNCSAPREICGRRTREHQEPRRGSNARLLLPICRDARRLGLPCAGAC